MHDVDPEAINAETKPELGYDHRDANWTTVWKVYKAFVAFCTVMVAISIGIQWGFTKTKPGQSFRPEHVMSPPRDPNPLLQSGDQARLDIANMRRDARKRLDSYGKDLVTNQTWVPIDRAMEMAEQRGLNPSSGAKEPGN